MQLYVGCSGWFYDGWLGHYYPANLDHKDFLKYYSQIFDFVEIQVLTAFPFNVEGQPVHTPAATAVPDTTSTKKVVIADGQSYQVTLDFQPKPPIARSSVKMTFEIKDANNQPISNLEPLMAAGGHCVIIDADSHDFLHVHPAKELGGGDDDDDVAHRVLTRLANWRGGPSVSFMANFPKPGLYRVWGQFQHEGRVLIADFTFEVPG